MALCTVKAGVSVLALCTQCGTIWIPGSVSIVSKTSISSTSSAAFSLLPLSLSTTYGGLICDLLFARIIFTLFFFHLIFIIYYRFFIFLASKIGKPNLWFLSITVYQW